MPFTETLYEAALAGARPVIGAGALVSERVARAVHGRRDSLRRFEAWSSRDRDPDRRLVWFHAPSVGEALMAQAIIGIVRERRPDVQVAFTSFSPSADRIVAGVGADVWGYVPWDTRGPVRRVLRALRPRVLVFVRTEVWPVLSREARRAGARLLLVNAVLAEGSGRLSWMGRAFLEGVYRRLDAVGAVSPDDAARYELLGVPPGAIRVTGDARFDQVRDRIDERGLRAVRSDGAAAIDGLPAAIQPIFRVLHDPAAFTLVAGSTWSSDEKLLVPAVGALRREDRGRIRLVVAPHDPTPSRLEALERRLEKSAFRHARLGTVLAAGAAPPEVVVVDRLGVLADLYALADAAYVGGGFRSAGLHSVVEPAGLGVPVLFGPGHGNAREAGELAKAGGGFVVESPGDIAKRLRTFRSDPAAHRAAGERAAEYFRSRTGAAARNAELVLARV